VRFYLGQVARRAEWHVDRALRGRAAGEHDGAYGMAGVIGRDGPGEQPLGLFLAEFFVAGVFVSAPLLAGPCVIAHKYPLYLYVGEYSVDYSGSLAFWLA